MRASNAIKSRARRRPPPRQKQGVADVGHGLNSSDQCRDRTSQARMGLLDDDRCLCFNRIDAKFIMSHAVARGGGLDPSFLVGLAGSRRLACTGHHARVWRHLRQTMWSP